MRNDRSITIAGEAGQGVQSIEAIMVALFKGEGRRVHATKEYMSRVRGGTNSTTIRYSPDPVRAWSGKMDLLVPLDAKALSRLGPWTGKDTVVLGDAGELPGAVDLPFSRIAADCGSARYASSVVVGALCALAGLRAGAGRAAVAGASAARGDEVRDGNIAAFTAGYAAAEAAKAAFPALELSTPPAPGGSPGPLLSGADAIALGAIAGGCDAAFAYPMSPGTSVFTALAGYARRAGIAVEQAEDEIAAVNMAIGAWFAGGRAMVSTSGGGFALMTEGLSLAGMIESPLVVHLAQRPGPATGLPTRTEQGDLQLAIRAGHGSFPRIVYAPGSIEEAFFIARLAFENADRFQVPVIILTDQYLVDSYYDADPLGAIAPPAPLRIVEAPPDYRRYAITPDGLSPRAVPGHGQGIVRADSDEHDEEGRITEDLPGASMAMKRKRARKAALLAGAALPPVLAGPDEYETLFVGWGSTELAIKEALRNAGIEGAAALHFPQVHPLPREAEGYLRRAKRVVAVENQEEALFARTLREAYGIGVDAEILKFDGLAFTVGELEERMAEEAGR